ncbi:hypothetical protein KC351_g113 [Hortaea werneckii]|nr:hypothetical protein KC351_g113 [Hortaea werneckii]
MAKSSLKQAIVSLIDAPYGVPTAEISEARVQAEHRLHRRHQLKREDAYRMQAAFLALPCCEEVATSLLGLGLRQAEECRFPKIPPDPSSLHDYRGCPLTIGKLVVTRVSDESGTSQEHIDLDMLDAAGLLTFILELVPMIIPHKRAFCHHTTHERLVSRLVNSHVLESLIIYRKSNLCYSPLPASSRHALTSLGRSFVCLTSAAFSCRTRSSVSWFCRSSPVSDANSKSSSSRWFVCLALLSIDR